MVLPPKGMGFAFKFCQRMIVANQSHRLSVAYLVDGVDGIARFADMKALTVEYFSITEGVELGEAIGEFEGFAVNEDGALGLLSGDAEIVTHIGVFQLEKSSYTVVGGNVDDAVLHVTEDPAKHVVEMHTDVGGNAAAFSGVAFPGGIIPIASWGDISQVDIVDFVFGSVLNLFLQRNDGIVQTKL